MEFGIHNHRKQLRITDLYLIYVLSGGDVRHTVYMDNIFNHGEDSSYGRKEKSKTVDYFVQKNWIVLNENPEYPLHSDNYAVYITAFGIDQAEMWEEKHSLDKRLTGRSYWLAVDWSENIKDTSNIYGQEFLKKLRDNVKLSFSESDLKDLCFDLDIDYDDLPDSSRKDKIREVILYLKRRKRIPEFIQICRDKRPHTHWHNG